MLHRFQGTPGTPRDIETAQVHPHCIFSSVGYEDDPTGGGGVGVGAAAAAASEEVAESLPPRAAADAEDAAGAEDAARRLRQASASASAAASAAQRPPPPPPPPASLRRFVYTREASREGAPLLFAGNASLGAFPSCFVSSHPRGALPHETYCFSPRVVHARRPPRWPGGVYERGVLLSWAGGIENFGHMVFEQILRVHTLLSLDAQDGHGDSADLVHNTLIVLLWGCDLRREHGGPSDSKDNGTGTQRYWHKVRWQAIPVAFGPADGRHSSFRRWLRLFSSLEPVCLGELPSGVGFRRLHVGDVHLDHFTSLGAKPNQYNAFVHYMAAATRKLCHGRRSPPPLAWSPILSGGGGPSAFSATAASTSTSTSTTTSTSISPSSSRPALVLLLDKAEGRRRPLNLADAAAVVQKRLGGAAKVVVLHNLNESMPACEQLRWLQAADVVVTQGGAPIRARR